MMSKSIYNIFDCKNKTEFVKKLKSEDKAFEDIFSLAKEYKEHYQNKNFSDSLKTYSIYLRLNFYIYLVILCMWQPLFL